VLWHRYDDTQAVTSSTSARVLKFLGIIRTWSSYIQHQNRALLSARMLVFAWA